MSETTPFGAEEPTDASASTFLAIAFDEPLLAQEALLAAVRLQTHGRLRLEDAAIVGKDDNGRVRVPIVRPMISFMISLVPP
jgi:uncharacterized membrane protein